jgi:hypothetical protein
MSDAITGPALWVKAINRSLPALSGTAGEDEDAVVLTFQRVRS